MRMIRQILVFVLSALLVAPSARAQQVHVADQAMLDRAVAIHAQQADSDREAIRQVLQRQQVREIAGRVGFDVKRAETAIATLDSAELHEIAVRARAVDDSLAGGASTVTISTTTVIIGLLVLILIIVAVR